MSKRIELRLKRITVFGIVYMFWMLCWWLITAFSEWILDMIKHPTTVCTHTKEMTQIIELIENQKCELITYEKCIEEPIDCFIDSRSPTWKTCRPMK